MKNHLHKMNRGILALLVVTSMFYSCSEDDELFPEFDKVENHMVFEDYDEYFQTVKRSLNMGINELVTWQKERGVNSKSIKALQIYYSFNFEAIKSESELYNFLNKNSDYLQIIEFEEEKYLEPIYYNKSNRFIINESNIFQVEDKIHKVFSKGEIIGNIEDKDYLITLEESKFMELAENIDENGNFSVLLDNESMSYVVENRALSCGTGDTRAIDNGRNRTRVTISAKDKSRFGNFKYEVDWIVRPYLRTLGIWYHATRTITYEVDFSVWLYTGNGNYTSWGLIGGPLRGVTSSAQYSVSDSYEYNGTTNGADTNSSDIFFGKYYLYGNTPSTPPVVISCNY